MDTQFIYKIFSSIYQRFQNKKVSLKEIFASDYILNYASWISIAAGLIILQFQIFGNSITCDFGEVSKVPILHLTLQQF